jgi:hypothetical protein
VPMPRKSPEAGFVRGKPGLRFLGRLPVAGDDIVDAASPVARGCRVAAWSRSSTFHVIVLALNSTGGGRIG